MCIRDSARAERTAAGAPHADLVASAVAATFTGILADWLHDSVPGSPAELADHVWPLLLALHRAGSRPTAP